jgi:hypothetical protein
MPPHVVGVKSGNLDIIHLMAVIRHEGKGLQRMTTLKPFRFEVIVEKLKVLGLHGVGFEIPFFIMPSPDFVDAVVRQNGETSWDTCHRKYGLSKKPTNKRMRKMGRRESFLAQFPDTAG